MNDKVEDQSWEEFEEWLFTPEERAEFQKESASRLAQIAQEVAHSVQAKKLAPLLNENALEIGASFLAMREVAS